MSLPPASQRALPLHSPPPEEAPWRDPLAVFAPLATIPFAQFLESSYAPGRTSVIVADPVRTLTVQKGRIYRDGHPVAGDTQEALQMLKRDLSRDLRAGRSPPLPFCGGAVGMLAYEWGSPPCGDSPLRSPPKNPMMVFGLYESGLCFDHLRRRVFIFGPRRELWRHRLESCAGDVYPVFPSGGLAVETSLSRALFEARVAEVVRRIHAGDVFQVNLACRFEVVTSESPLAVYRRVRHLSPAPFGAFLNLGGLTLLSASPERFVRVRGEDVETCPIKGTRPRGRTLAEDRAFVRDLLSSSKDRCENVMIADLMRNDLARICRPGTVTTDVLCGLESFPAVHHLVSRLQGRLCPGLGAVDVLQACFPPGSVTGAPKQRAMEIIRDLEPVPRGPYCGVFGYIGFDGSMDMSVAIRILALEESRAHVWAGAGIVARSDPHLEWQETSVKARPLLAALGAQEVV